MIKCKHEENGICKKGIKTMCEFCDHFVPDKKIQNRLDMIRNKDDEELIEVLRYYRSVRKCEVCAFGRDKNKCNPYNAKTCNDGMIKFLKEEVDNG